MKLFLLDAAGAELILLLPVAFVLFLFFWGLAEGFIINLFKINRFWKSVWHAMLVNLVSVIAGFVILNVTDGTQYEDFFELEADTRHLSPWVIYWIVSVVIEALVLKLLNRSAAWSKIFTASVVMNIITYVFLYFFYFYFN
jgi:hypothetical protein